MRPPWVKILIIFRFIYYYFFFFFAKRGLFQYKHLWLKLSNGLLFYRKERVCKGKCFFSQILFCCCKRSFFFFLFKGFFIILFLYPFLFLSFLLFSFVFCRALQIHFICVYCCDMFGDVFCLFFFCDIMFLKCYSR